MFRKRTQQNPSLEAILRKKAKEKAILSSGIGYLDRERVKRYGGFLHNDPDVDYMRSGQCVAEVLGLVHPGIVKQG